MLRPSTSRGFPTSVRREADAPIRATSKLSRMSSLIEDYAIIGDTETVALVARNGSIDWMCVPRFDGGACFAALLGGREHGRWLMHPTGQIDRIERRYIGDTLVLETLFHTSTGS